MSKKTKLADEYDISDWRHQYESKSRKTTLIEDAAPKEFLVLLDTCDHLLKENEKLDDENGARDERITQLIGGFRKLLDAYTEVAPDGIPTLDGPAKLIHESRELIAEMEQPITTKGN